MILKKWITYGFLVLLLFFLGCSKKNQIHFFIICGTIQNSGVPVANRSGEVFTWFGGKRYLLEGKSLEDSGREDRARFFRKISTDDKGQFCTERVGIKYFYKLDHFKLIALQVSVTEKPNLEKSGSSEKLSEALSDLKAKNEAVKKPRKRKVMPSGLKGNAYEGYVMEGSMDHENRVVKLNAVFEMDDDAAKALVPKEKPSEIFEKFFNHKERFEE